MRRPRRADNRRTRQAADREKFAQAHESLSEGFTVAKFALDYAGWLFRL